jgi:hypothetical protein
MNIIARTALSIAVCTIIGSSLCAAQDQTSHAAATVELLTLMNVEQTMAQTTDMALAAQLQGNEALKPYEDIMRAFIGKYLNWNNMKDKLVALYMGEFTEAEVRTMIAFYKTPAGKKAIEKLPLLMTRGGELGQAEVQAHMSELTNAIQKRKEQLDPGNKK